VHNKILSKKNPAGKGRDRFCKYCYYKSLERYNPAFFDRYVPPPLGNIVGHVLPGLAHCLPLLSILQNIIAIVWKVKRISRKHEIDEQFLAIVSFLNIF
jgi:hypothetical protein